MTVKKITPKNPEVSAKAGSKDESKATARKTQNRQWRKLARKSMSHGY